MIIVKLEFQSGRFHANPWGRNVNENIPEWPPSPYRLVRAIIDVWKRKFPSQERDKIEPILELLSSSLPVQLIYDEFVVMNPGDSVFIGWENITLEAEQKKLLSELLSFLNYLGRSESWVNATLYEDSSGIDWNCYPVENYDKYNKDIEMQDIPVAVPMTKIDYDKKPFYIKQEGKSVKLEWLDSLMLRTDEMINEKLSIPPAMQYKIYKRRTDCFHQQNGHDELKAKNNITAVLYALDSKILPLVTETIGLSEKVHVKLMGIQKRFIGDRSAVSQKFSGRNPDGSFLVGHKHIYILPLDINEDGRIDHILITCKEPFDSSELSVLDHLNSIWQSGGRPDIHCIPIQWGAMKEDITVCEVGTIFKSVTPFVPTRHYRKGRGNYEQWLANEVKHEAKNHSLPEPIAVRKLEKSDKKGHSYYWLEFKRNRKGDAIRHGYGFEIEFSVPIIGPFSIGYGAHFGLGLFMPLKK